MPKYTVYFKVGDSCFRTAHDEGVVRLDHPLDPTQYELAAAVEAKGFGDVFRICNSIDAPWTENPEVRCVYTSRPRSMSVGDLIVDEGGGITEIEGAGYCQQPPHVSLPFVATDELEEILNSADVIIFTDAVLVRR